MIQPTEYQEQGPFPAKTHETALDRLAMHVQRLWISVQRSILLPFGSEASNEFPPAESDKFIRWNNAGDRLVNSDAEGPGLGDVFGPNGATSGNVAIFGNNSGKVIADGGRNMGDVGDVFAQGGSVTADNLPAYADGGGKLIKDSGVPSAQVARRDQFNTFTLAQTIETAAGRAYHVLSGPGGGSVAMRPGTAAAYTNAFEITCNGNGITIDYFADQSTGAVNAGIIWNDLSWVLNFATGGAQGAGTINTKGAYRDGIEYLHPAAPNGLTIGNATGGAQGAGTLNAENLFINGNPVGGGGASGYDVIHIQEKKAPSDNQGGTPAQATWQTRLLNEKVIDTGNHCTLDGGGNGQFTLAPGTYEIDASVPYYKSNYCKARLYNVTTAAVMQYGATTYMGADANNSNGTFLRLRYRFTLPATQTLRIEGIVASANANFGLGIGYQNQGDNIFTDVWIRRLRAGGGSGSVDYLGAFPAAGNELKALNVLDWSKYAAFYFIVEDQTQSAGGGTLSAVFYNDQAAVVNVYNRQMIYGQGSSAPLSIGGIAAANIILRGGGGASADGAVNGLINGWLTGGPLRPAWDITTSGNHGGAHRQSRNAGKCGTNVTANGWRLWVDGAPNLDGGTMHMWGYPR